MLRLAAPLLALVLHACGGGNAQPLPPPGPVPVPFGAPWVTSLTADGVSWNGCASYVARDGGGCFIQFLTPDRAGRMQSGVTLNGGLVDATPDALQGDLDIVFFVDNKPTTVAFTGRWHGAPPGLVADPSGLLSIGGPANRWADVWLTEHACSGRVPGSPAACVRVNGGEVPVYR